MKAGIWIRTLAALFLVLLFVTPAPASESNVFVRANAEPDTLDPHKMKLLSELHVLRDLFEGLTKSDANGIIVGGAAKTWDVSDDGTTYTFHLRDGLKWSDGHPLTAHDFVAGYRRLFDPATAAQSAAFLYTIKNGQEVNAGRIPVADLAVHAPDDKTVVIQLKGPNPPFPALIISGYTAPFPRHALRKHGSDWAKPENLISNGAFQLAEWVPHTHISLTPNPHYRDHENIQLKEVRYLPVTDPSTSVKQFRAGEAHMVSGIPLAQTEQMMKLYPESFHTTPEMATLYLVPNFADEKLKDLRIRKALSLATDRSVLTQKLMRGFAEPVWAFTPSSISHYTPPQLAYRNSALKDRLEEARGLLKEAGFDEATPLALELRTTESRDAKAIAMALRSMWKRVGIEVTILTTEIKTHYADLSGGNFQLAVASYYGWDDPFEFLSLFMAATTQVSFNYGRYDNPVYDNTLEEALAIAEIEHRHQLMAEAEAILLSDHAVIPLFTPVSRSLVAPQVSGYHDNPLNLHPSEYISLID